MSQSSKSPGGVVPYLIVRGAREAIDFYVRAFDAHLLYDLEMPGGAIAHAELTVAGQRFMLADEFPDMGYLGPQSRGGTSVSLVVYVDDVDAVVARAVKEGATVERPVEDQFFGDRVGHLVDPFEHRWSFHTRLEDLTPDEIRERMKAEMGG